MQPTFHDPSDAQKWRRRLLKQRKYQAKYRENLKGGRVPERDHVANAALRIFFKFGIKDPRWAGVRKLLIENLVSAGFNEKASGAKIDAMMRRATAKAGEDRG